MESNLKKLETADFLIYNLSIYTKITEFDNDVETKILEYLHYTLVNIYDDDANFYNAARYYSDFCHFLYHSKFMGNFPDYLFDFILYHDNIFTRECSKNNFFKIPTYIKNSATTDINAFYALSLITSRDIKDAMGEQFPDKREYVELLPDFASKHAIYSTQGCWGDNLLKLAEFYRSNGVGDFAKYKAFSFVKKNHEYILKPVSDPDDIKLSDLKQYEVQRRKIVENTLAFVHSKPCNNVLLYGDRGTGKSSTVKALLNEYSGQGLRMIQIDKSHLFGLGTLIEQIASVPLKFIIFIDDLTFNENDDNFGMLKAVLEGSLVKRPPNIVIYATSNRRHLIKETFSAREGDEIHKADTIDENLSLSDRFGLSLTFLMPNKDNFLAIVESIALDRDLKIDRDLLLKGAERFALAKSGRTPRLAKQYVDHVQARLELDLPIE
ncbi:MAG: putative ATPase superfamily [Oscillospiraceae bacterium]|jgi:predicted AAA+ superfamily ATPase|nr:putative ATPase superfamily [Oscillospiraceae bacterium]